MKHIPNALTILRLLLAFGYPFLPHPWRLPCIILSLVTEFLDGYLARKFNWGSPSGALLDPIADKAFVFSVAFTMFFESNLTWWQFLLVGARDAVVFFGAMSLIMEHNYEAFMHVIPRWSGKIATVFQFAFLISYAYWKEINPYILYSTIVASCVAGGDYLHLLFKKNFYRKYL